MVLVCLREGCVFVNSEFSIAFLTFLNVFRIFQFFLNCICHFVSFVTHYILSESSHSCDVVRRMHIVIAGICVKKFFTMSKTKNKKKKLRE